MATSSDFCAEVGMVGLQRGDARLTKFEPHEAYVRFRTAAVFRLVNSIATLNRYDVKNGMMM